MYSKIKVINAEAFFICVASLAFDSMPIIFDGSTTIFLNEPTTLHLHVFISLYISEHSIITVNVLWNQNDTVLFFLICLNQGWHQKTQT